MKGVPESVEELGAKLITHLGLPPEISLAKFSDNTWLKDLISRIPRKEREIALLQKLVENKELAQYILAVLRKDTTNRTKSNTDNSEADSESLKQIPNISSLQVSRDNPDNSPNSLNQIPTLTPEENTAIETILEKLHLLSDNDLTLESKRIFTYVKKNFVLKEQDRNPLPLAAVCIFRATRNTGKFFDISTLYNFLKQGGVKPRVFRDLLFQIFNLIKLDNMVPVRPDSQNSPASGESRKVNESGRVCFGGRAYYVDRSWNGKFLFVKQEGNTITVQDARGQKIPVSLKSIPKSTVTTPKIPSTGPKSSKPIPPVNSISNSRVSQPSGGSRKVDVSGRVRFGGRTYYVDRSWSGKDLFVQQEGNTITVQDARGQKIPVSLKIMPKPPATPLNAPSTDLKSSKPVFPAKSESKVEVQTEQVKLPLINIEDAKKTIEKGTCKVDNSGRVSYSGISFQVDPAWINKTILIEKDKSQIRLYDLFGNLIRLVDLAKEK